MKFDRIIVVIDGRAFPSDLTAAKAGKAHIAGDLIIKWSRPNSIAATDPQDIQLTIRRRRDGSDPTDLFNLDARITVRIVVGGLIADVFDGFIDRVRFEPTRLTDWQDVKIGAVCWQTRAQRRRIGATPWPRENMATRYSRLDTILPELIDRPAILAASGWIATAMDIDSRDPIEVVNEHFAVASATTHASLGGIRHTKVSSLNLTRLTIRTLQGHAYINQTFATPVVTLPAAAIADVGRELSFDSALSAITVNFTFATDDGEFSRETSRTYGDSSDPGSTMSITSAETITTSISVADQDEFDALQPGSPNGASTYQGAVARSAPAYRLDPLTIRFKDIPDTPEAAIQPADVIELVGLDSRWNTQLNIEGAPADVPATHRLIGGELLLSGDPDRCRLTVTPEPGSYLGWAPPVGWSAFDPGDTWEGSAAWEDMAQRAGDPIVTWRAVNGVQQINARD